LDVDAVVSASMDGLQLIIEHHFDSIDPAELGTICAVVWKATETATVSTIYRSAFQSRRRS
jgi:hypothetical protein